MSAHLAVALALTLALALALALHLPSSPDGSLDLGGWSSLMESLAR